MDSNSRAASGTAANGPRRRIAAAVERLDRADAWLAAGLGALLPCAFAPFGLWWLAVLCTAGLFWLWRDCSPRRAARLGFLYGAATFLVGTYWLYISIRIFGRAPVALALFLMLALVAIMGGYHAALGYVTVRWLRGRPLVAGLAGFPAAWLLIEWLRGWVASGFPWLSLGYSQIDSPLAGLAPVAGVYAVSWAVAASAGAVYAAVLGRRPLERLVPLALVALLWSGGGLLRGTQWTQPAGEPFAASIIQGAVPQDRKWLPEERSATLELYRELTRAHFGSRLVVWPEAAAPGLVEQLRDYLAELHREARAHDTDILLGILHYEPEADRMHNALLALADDVALYYKRHLVPFGEFFPVPDIVRKWLRLMSLPYSDFAPGDDDQPPLEAAGQTIGASICYEDAFGAEQLVYLPEATLLVNVTNDAWFGDSTAPHQHLEIARMRSLEAGRWQLRAANTGISALIGPHGEIRARSRQFEPQVLSGELQPLAGATPYVRWGNWPVLILGAAAALATALWLRHGKSNVEGPDPS